MAEIILDTNILIEILKGDQKTIDVVEEFETLYISEVSAMELYYGALDKKELLKLKKFIDIFELLHIDTAISRLASTLVYEYAKSHNLNIPDALIAATSIVHNRKLFTYNRKDFRYIKELRLIPWTTSLKLSPNSLEGGVFSHMKNMISLHREVSKSLKLNLVDHYLLNHKKNKRIMYPFF